LWEESQFFKMRTDSREKRAPILGGGPGFGARMPPSSAGLLVDRLNASMAGELVPACRWSLSSSWLLMVLGWSPMMGQGLLGNRADESPQSKLLEAERAKLHSTRRATQLVQ